MTTKYSPSNGTEGMIFLEQWCFECKRDEKYQQTENGEDGCPILAASFAYDVDDPRYPAEWVIRNGEPICTAFVPIAEEIPYMRKLENAGQKRLF